MSLPARVTPEPPTARETLEMSEAVPFHCGNQCPVPGEWDPVTDLYPCGWRHWCPWCGDCEYCYDEGPHDWD